ncbi:hypothetical protein COO60DRAFT_603636 [Scenedesmus sp. NREL 46B-D3]|nr:hypothetical protein COO60DRAFT_603636 [Scenedesmus sp. NREL 46B-D3]
MLPAASVFTAAPWCISLLATFAAWTCVPMYHESNSCVTTVHLLCPTATWEVECVREQPSTLCASLDMKELAPLKLLAWIWCLLRVFYASQRHAASTLTSTWFMFISSPNGAVQWVEPALLTCAASHAEVGRHCWLACCVAAV